MVCGREEGVEVPEEAGFVLAVEDVVVEEGVEACVELGVVEVAGDDELEEAA